MNIRKVMLSLTVVVSISGCAVTPEPLTQNDRVQRAAADLEKLFQDQETVSGTISLAEAMARAIRYNLDHRVKLLEEAVVAAEGKVARMDLLPQIAASAGYTTRSNVAASSSQSIITGLQSLEPSTSQDRTRALADATVVWNVLDFGVSYVTAKQRADRVLIAEEQRRKAVQNIIQDVRVAYWQALSAAQLEKETDELIDQTRSALNKSKKLQDKGLQPPMAAMQYQESLLASLRTLLQLRQQLSTSRAELAALMNLRPGSEFDLAAAPEERDPPAVNTELNELEEFGLLHRPELRESDYQVRISMAETKKAMLRMLPGLEIDLGTRYDDNKFLVNNDWSDAGIRITWNLFNLLAAPANQKRAEAQLEVDRTRRMAVSMAVLSQVNVAHQRYRLAKKDFELAETLMQVKLDIAEEQRVRRQANVSNELTEIRSRLDALVARLQRDQALAELQNAVGRMHNSIGLDPLPAEVMGYDIATLTKAVALHQTKLKDMLVQPQMDPEAYDRIAREVKAEQERQAAIEARERAIAERDKALAERQLAEQAAAKAAEQKAAREQAAEAARMQALAAQQAAVESAIAEAEAKRLAEEELAKVLALAEQRASEAEAARKAAQEAAQLAEAAKAAADLAAAQRAAEAERIAAEVKSKMDAAVQTALGAGAAEKLAEQAGSAAQEAEQRLRTIEIPEVPPEGAPAGAKQDSGYRKPGIKSKERRFLLTLDSQLYVSGTAVRLRKTIDAEPEERRQTDTRQTPPATGESIRNTLQEVVTKQGLQQRMIEAPSLTFIDPFTDEPVSISSPAGSASDAAGLSGESLSITEPASKSVTVD